MTVKFIGIKMKLDAPAIRNCINSFSLLLACWGTVAHLGIVFAVAQTDDKAAKKRVDFVRDVKPILSAKCFQCHGPDEKTREAELRFDGDRDGFEHVIESDDESNILGRLTSADADLRMPPTTSKVSPLSDREVAILKMWIEQGANVAKHWSYQVIDRPRVPVVENDDWSRNPIDKFVLKKLRQNGLHPSPAATLPTLLRRLAVDLVGLPPAASLGRNESRPDLNAGNYHQAVEQLLASPEFGEKMAIDWLDLVRYADTSGIHSDNPISMSPYRDYVIDSFNDDMPFDQFTREQLAGDLIPDASQSQLVASAYNRLNMMTTEGGAQDGEYLAKYAADRVRTTSTVWLGSTLGCAECHDHKYDPFETKDFYQFAAYFADITEKGYYPGAERSGDWGPKLFVPSQQELAAEKKTLAEIEQLRLRIEELENDYEKNRSKWEDETRKKILPWTIVSVRNVRSANGTQFQRLEDGSFLAKGNRPNIDTYSVEIEGVKELEGVCLEVLPHESLPKNGPGRAGNGNFVVSEIRIEVAGRTREMQPKFIDASASFEQTLAGEHTPYKIWNAASAIDLDRLGPKPGWAILPEVGKYQSAIFKLSKKLVLDGNTKLTIHLEQKHDNPGHVLGRFRLAGITKLGKRWKESKQVSVELGMILQKDDADRSDAEKKRIRDFFVASMPQISLLKDKLKSLQTNLETMKKSRTSVLITVARKPRTMRILPRGDWMDQSGEIVFPEVPNFLSDNSKTNSGNQQNRMDLANWITDPQNPLTARVQVNRIWRKFFGEGLVESADDFGSQGNVPSHPELLDWLASEFIESGWDQKHLIRLVVESSTYRQASTNSKSLSNSDPKNRLLARQNAVRLDAEIIRDQALAASGMLVRKVGGRSVKPYQPAGYYQHLNFPRRTYKPSTGSAQYRRGVYTHWQRLFLHPMLQAFDAPSREECTAKRVRSNTPQQALVLLNDPSFLEAAQAMAKKVVAESDTFDDRIDSLYQSVLGRKPLPIERDVLRRLAGKTKGKSDVDSWVNICRVMFNLHEFTTRY